MWKWNHQVYFHVGLPWKPIVSRGVINIMVAETDWIKGQRRLYGCRNWLYQGAPSTLWLQKLIVSRGIIKFMVAETDCIKGHHHFLFLQKADCVKGHHQLLWLQKVTVSRDIINVYNSRKLILSKDIMTETLSIPEMRMYKRTHPVVQ